MAAMLCAVLAFAPAPNRPAPCAPRAHGRTIAPAMNAGALSVYEGALTPLPENVYEVLLERPLGIGFEEDGPIYGKNGVSVTSIVEDSNAAKGQQVMMNIDGSNVAVDGKVEVGDKLVGVTAIQFVGAKWERKMFDCSKWDFETVVEAIGSNEEKFVSNFCILKLKRPTSSAPPQSETV